jgi:hypothetical protein
LSCSASHIAVFLNEICSLSFIKHIPIQLSISPLDIGFLSYAPFFSDPDYPGWDCVAQFGFLLISKRLNRKFILTTLSWETFPIYLPVLESPVQGSDGNLPLPVEFSCIILKVFYWASHRVSCCEVEGGVSRG